MQHNIKAVFFDIDGTLVSFKTHCIPESTKKALKLLREKGIRLFIATGRHKAFIDNLGDEQFDAYITVNGQLCLNEQTTIYRKAIDPNDIITLVNDMKRHERSCIFVGEHDYFINHINQTAKEMMKLLNFPYVKIGTPIDATKMPIYQIVAFVDKDEEEQFMQNLPHCSPTRWHNDFIDVVPQGGSKQVGIDKIIDFYRIPLSETLSFGDGENDIPMLTHTAIGVAMGNGNENVKNAATMITDSVDEDGIYNALKRLEII